MTHSLINRDGYQECIRCGTCFDSDLPDEAIDDYPCSESWAHCPADSDGMAHYIIPTPDGFRCYGCGLRGEG